MTLTLKKIFSSASPAVIHSQKVFKTEFLLLSSHKWLESIRCIRNVQNNFWNHFTFLKRFEKGFLGKLDENFKLPGI